MDGMLVSALDFRFKDSLIGKSEDVLILANMWQAGDIGTCRSDGSYESALASIKANMLVMPCRTDQYFPPEDSEIEMKHLKHGKFAPIESIWGHVAGGGANPPDIKFMDATIAEFLKA
jgi:homoserine acetyltransferase